MSPTVKNGNGHRRRTAPSHTKSRRTKPTHTNNTITETETVYDPCGLQVTHKIFADEWIKTRNSTRSYQKAKPGISDNSAAFIGHNILKRPEVKNYIAKRLDEISDAAEVTQEWIIKKLKKQVDYNINTLYSENHKKKSLKDISEDLLWAVEGYDKSGHFILPKKEIAMKALRELMGYGNQGRDGNTNNFNGPTQILIDIE